MALGEYAPRSVQCVRLPLLQWHRFAGPIGTWTGDRAAAWVHDQRLRPNTRKMRLSRLRPYVRWLVQRWVRAAGLKAFPYDGISAHALRHSCAQGMLDLGADIRLVQAALGHHHQSTTELYLRREPPGLREAMEGRRYAA